jgi:DNA-binding transcriptional ArsR family regulator
MVSRKASMPQPPPAAYRVRDLTQVKALAHPLRLRLLEAFATVPSTTKQVASLLGEKPTRLYHHVDALERAGLLKLKETRPNRGTIEKYYVAVARQLEVDNALFSSERRGRPGVASKVAMARTVLDAVRSEVVDHLQQDVKTAPGLEPVIGRATVEATPAEVRTLRARVLTLLNVNGKRAKRSTRSKLTPRRGTGATQRYVLAVAFYPVDSDGAKPGG